MPCLFAKKSESRLTEFDSILGRHSRDVAAPEHLKDRLCWILISGFEAVADHMFGLGLAHFGPPKIRMYSRNMKKQHLQDFGLWI